MITRHLITLYLSPLGAIAYRDRSYGREASIRARCSAASVGRCGAPVDRFDGCNRRVEVSVGCLEASIRRLQPSEGRVRLHDIVLNLQNARLRPQNSLLEPQNDLLSAPHTVRSIIQRSPNELRRPRHGRQICIRDGDPWPGRRQSSNDQAGSRTVLSTGMRSR